MLTIDQLPPRIDQYLGSYYTTVKNLRLADRYGLRKGEQLDTFAALVGRLFLKEFGVAELPTKLRDELKLSNGQSFLLASEIAEQHLKGYEDFIGPVTDNIDLWRSWGREFGGRQPGPKAAPEIEKLVAKAGQVQRTPAPLSVEKRRTPSKARAVTAPTVRPRPSMDGTARPQATVTVETTQRPQASAAQPAQQETDPAQAKQHFLGQLQSLSIESVRQNGQAATQRLQEIVQNVQAVVARNPEDRAAIGQAVAGSKLAELYRQQGQEIVRSGRSADEVIYARYQSQQPYLIKEEFEAAAELMKLASAPAMTSTT